MEEGMRKAMAFASAGCGVASQGITVGDDAKVLRFSVQRIQNHIKDWVSGNPKASFYGVDGLKSAVDDLLLRPGQLIFQEVPISEHFDLTGFQGWICDTFAPIITAVGVKQPRKFAYFHVAVYVG